MAPHNNIDDLFKGKLGNFAEEPSASVWEGVEYKLKYRSFFRKGIILLAILLILGSASIALWITRTQQTPATKTSLIQQNETTGQTQNPTNTTTNTSLNQTSETIYSQDISEKKPNQTSAQKVSPAPAHIIANNKIDPPVASTAYRPTTAPINSTLQTPTTEPIATLKKGTTQTPAHINTLTLGQKQEALANIEKSEQAINQNIIKEPINNVSTSLPSSIHPALPESEEQITLPLNNNDETVVVTPEVENSNVSEETPVLLTKDSTTSLNVSPAPVVQAQNPMYKPSFDILFYTSPSYVTKGRSTESPAQKTERQLREDNALFVNYGMEFRCTMKNFTVQTGLRSSQAGEHNNYTYNTLQQIDTSGGYFDVQTVSYPDPQNPGNTIVTFDSVWMGMADSTFTQQQLGITNKLNYLEIPLSIGYNFNFGNHHLGFSGGLSYAFLTKANVAIYDPESFSIINYTHKDSRFRKNMWAYHFNLSYGYSISGNTILFIEGGYKQHLSDAISASKNKLFYRFIDAKAGVMFKL